MNYMTTTSERATSLAILLIRLMTGLILFVAGAGKALGWFGGMGMDMTVTMFRQGMNIPAWLAYTSTYVELICGFLLAIGWLTRPAALLLTINMLVATVLVGTKNFFSGGGAFPCLLMVTSLALLLTGPMRYSIDALLARKKRSIHYQTQKA
jgi:putative oxidoreductase